MSSRNLSLGGHAQKSEISRLMMSTVMAELGQPSRGAGPRHNSWSTLRALLGFVQAEAAAQQGKTLILFNPLLRDVASPDGVMSVR